MTLFLEILGLLLALAGLVGCVLPVIPGVPLSYAALLVLSVARHWEPFSALFLVGMAALVLFVSALDYIVPALGAKKYGASRAGVWGSVIGMLIGLFFFPPFGVFIGAFAGAVIGEMISGKETQGALRAGWGVFLGTAVSVAFKLAASGLMLFFYLKALF
jgi:uncharacterized protein